MTRRKPPSDEIFQRRKRLAEQAARGELRLPEAFLQLRHALGLTQAEFGEICGMTRRQVADLETRPNVNPKLATLKRIAGLLGFEIGLVPRRAGRQKLSPRRESSSPAFEGREGD